MVDVGIVTGAARGMGRACAERLADKVDQLLLVDMDGPTLNDTAQALSAGGRRARVEPVVVDVTDRAAVQGLADRAAELGTLRAVVHAAGISPTMADWRRVLAVDLAGTAQLLAALRPLAGAGTAIVCFASMAARLGVPDPDPKALAVLDSPLQADLPDRLRQVVGELLEDSGYAYAWATFGVQRLVELEAVRLGRAGARICSLSPGVIDTVMGNQEADSNAAMRALVEQTPLGRLGDPAEIAAVVAFLLSEEAGFLTGVDILVDGGVCAAVLNASA